MCHSYIVGQKEQSQHDLGVEVTTFFDFRQASQSGSSAVNTSNNIQFGATVGKNYQK